MKKSFMSGPLFGVAFIFSLLSQCFAAEPSELAAPPNPELVNVIHFTMQVYNQRTVNADNNNCYTMVFREANNSARNMSLNWGCRVYADGTMECGNRKLTAVLDRNAHKLVFWQQNQWRYDEKKIPIFDARIYIIYTFDLPYDGGDGTFSIKGVWATDWPTDEKAKSMKNTNEIPSLCEIKSDVKVAFQPNPLLTPAEDPKQSLAPAN